MVLVGTLPPQSLLPPFLCLSQVLEVMEVYLAEPPPSTSPPAAGPHAGSSSSSELAPLSELALEKLKNMLLVMAASGAFEVRRRRRRPRPPPTHHTHPA